MPPNTPVLLPKLDDADSLLEEMRCILVQTDSQGQSVQRVEEVIAALKRLRWCLNGHIETGKDGRQMEAILRFSS